MIVEGKWDPRMCQRLGHHVSRNFEDMNFICYDCQNEELEQPKKERKQGMNLSTAVFLINDDARAVMVTYEEGDRATRTMFKTFDKNLKVDDFVVVPTNTRHHMTVCKVVEVDVEVDFDNDVQVDWIIGRVEKANFDDIKKQEESAINAIRAAEKLKKRKELSESMKALLTETGKDVKLLSIGPSEDTPKTE